MVKDGGGCFGLPPCLGLSLESSCFFTLKEPARSERGDIQKQVCHLNNCPYKNILAV